MFNLKNILRINKQEQLLFAISFVFICISFAPILFNYLWGNHDWTQIIVNNHIKSGFIEGRLTQYLLHCTLLNGKLLPIFNNIIGFALYSLGLTFIYTRFFEFPQNKFAYILIPISTLPYIIDIIYFQFIVLSQLSWILVISLSLISAKKATKTYNITFTILSTLLLYSAIAGYPASINLFVTATCLYVIKEINNIDSIKHFIKIIIPFLTSFFISLIALYITHQWLRSHHLMGNLYNNQTVNLKELVFKIFPIIKLSLLSLIQPQPFFSICYKIISSITLVIFIINYLHDNFSFSKLTKKIILIIMLLLLIKFSALLVDETKNDYFSKYDPIAFMVRADFYSIPVLLLFAFSYIFTYCNKISQNLALILAIFLLFSNINSNINFSKTNILGFKAENLLLERITSRIETSQQFNTQARYNIIQAGELALRNKYYTPSIFEKYGYYTLQIPFTRHWIPNEYYNFYYPYDFVKDGSHISNTDITDSMKNFLSTQLRYWPSQNSTFVDDKYAIIVLTPIGKNMIMQQFNAIRK